MRPISRCFFLVALTLLIASAGFGASPQYQLTTLATFNGTNGANPEGSVIVGADGNIYGTTYNGGAQNDGTVFKIAAGTHLLTTLGTFNGGNGAHPAAALFADPSGNLYGTTSGGPTGSTVGSAFEVAAGTHTLTNLGVFASPIFGKSYSGLLADSNGNLYGTTVPINGGPNNGAIFEIAAGTHAISTVATFNGGYGTYPEGNLIADANSNLYGTAHFGGISEYGTVFEMAAGTHALTALAFFNGANGQNPTNAGLISDAGGNLYGTAQGGEQYDGGSVFEVASGTHALTTLVAFNGLDGAGPFGSLIADASGNFYGTTEGSGAYGYGTVFEFDVGTKSLTTLFSFAGANGANPFCGLFADSSGNLYGTTYNGGANNLGTVFELSPVPEPSALTLTVTALIVGLFLRRVGSRSRINLLGTG